MVNYQEPIANLMYWGIVSYIFFSIHFFKWYTGKDASWSYGLEWFLKFALNAIMFVILVMRWHHHNRLTPNILATHLSWFMLVGLGLTYLYLLISQAMKFYVSMFSKGIVSDGVNKATRTVMAIFGGAMCIWGVVFASHLNTADLGAVGVPEGFIAASFAVNFVTIMLTTLRKVQSGSKDLTLTYVESVHNGENETSNSEYKRATRDVYGTMGGYIFEIATPVAAMGGFIVSVIALWFELVGTDYARFWFLSVLCLAAVYATLWTGSVGTWFEHTMFFLYMCFASYQFFPSVMLKGFIANGVPYGQWRHQQFMGDRANTVLQGSTEVVYYEQLALAVLGFALSIGGLAVAAARWGVKEYVRSKYKVQPQEVKA